MSLFIFFLHFLYFYSIVISRPEKLEGYYTTKGGIYMIRYGILGAGGHGLESHALAGKNVPELELVAISDINPQTMRKFCDAYGASLVCCPTEEELLESNIDAIVIATPDECHVQNLRNAIHAGKHVLIEKPLASAEEELSEIQVLLEVARKKGLVVTSCHPRRFDPPFLWLKENTQSFVHTLGPVVHFGFDFSYPRPNAAWKSNRSLMLDHLNHEIDLFHFLYGRQPFCAYLLHDSFDRYEVTGVRTSDCVTFRFHGTRRLPPRRPDEKKDRKFFEFACVRHERGEVHIDTQTGTATVINDETESTDFEACGKTDYKRRFRGVMQNFADTILGFAQNYLTPEDLWVNNWIGVELLGAHDCTYEL